MSTKNQKIINGIKCGDSEILKSFYKKNLPIVTKYIRKYKGTTEDVEDIFQDALVLLYHKAHSGALESIQCSVHTYFIGICKNKWRNQWRKQRILEYQELLENQALDSSDTVIDILTKVDQQELFSKHFTKLSTSSKQLLRLFFEGKSMKEIAHSIGLTEGYIRKKKHINKERLTQMIQSDPTYMELVVS